MPMTENKKQTLRNNEYYERHPVFDKLYANSKNEKIFTNLMKEISNEKNIILAYRNVKNNKGSTTSGTDGMTIRDIEKWETEYYVKTIQNKLKQYKSKHVKRVEIPKLNGDTRPLGIPSIIDRLVQQCIKQVLEPICEAKFHDSSYGFRPNRSTEHAIARCYKMMQRSHLHYVVDIDIKGFFDNVNHNKLIKQLWTMGIRDKTLICIIKEMLKAPIILPDNSKIISNKGTPQGGILSPLLANVVLNELDWWIGSQWELQNNHMRKPPVPQYNKNGERRKSNEYRELRKSKLKEIYIVRYADDFKIFCRNKADASKTFIAVKQWLSERLKLQISEEKSKVIDLRKHYSEFLGFKLKMTKKGCKMVVRSHMGNKAIKNVTQELVEQIKKIQKPKNRTQEAVEINKYNSIVLGIHNYYQIATNINLDCNRIQRIVSTNIVNRLRRRLSKKGETKDKAIKEYYGKSQQIRFVGQKAIAPIGYIQTRNPMNKKIKVNNYTVEGRAEIHDNLRINTTIQQALLRQDIKGKSIQFVDNRNSLWYAQYGRCAIIKEELTLNEIHCHHKIPRENGGTDEYKNLVIVYSHVHQLIHATIPETITKYLEKLNLTKPQINEINKYRKIAGFNQI
jgi:RNA-directed DNA polymerase